MSVYTAVFIPVAHAIDSVNTGRSVDEGVSPRTWLLDGGTGIVKPGLPLH